VANSGERPTAALTRAGVEYVELRALDVSPFDPVGINRRTADFLEVFLVYCLLAESPPAAPKEYENNSANHLDVARRGREPGLELRRMGQAVGLGDWGDELFDGMQAVAELMDPDGDRGCRDALDAQRAVLNDAERTPSARLLADLRETGLPLFTYAMDLSRRYRDYFASLDTGENPRLGMLRTESDESLARQRRIEAEDRLGFDDYLAAYYR
jgi:glutamate--cysteine ligase